MASSSPMLIPSRARKDRGSGEHESGSAYSVSPVPGPLKNTPPATPNMSQLHDIEDLNRHGHQLQTPWTFYFDRTVYGSTPDDYGANLKKLYTVKTVESFWGIFNHIPGADQIKLRCGYHLMRGTTRPMWEDVPNGGSWKVRVSKADTEKVWKELLLGVIGEQLQESVAEGDEIIGVSVTTRPSDDIVQIWNSNSALAPQSKVMDKLAELVPGVSLQKSFYKAHQDTLHKQ